MESKKRMLAQSIVSVLLVSCPAFAGTPLTGISESIPRQTLNQGGGISSAPGFLLAQSFGETGVTEFSDSSSKNVKAGILSVTAQPGTVTSITALSKSTGTIELAWTSPGLDGPLGDVTGGSYRIDYSSDPLHVFNPGTFLIQFSTDVSPNSAQSYLLGGLKPNTTYYTRIYLADADKFSSETSAPGADSTLANLPAAPVLSEVFSSSLTITWSLPAGGAEGFRIDASTTNFGFGTIASSSTVLLTMIVEGLSADTPYFFKLGSLNWQKDVNFTTILATRTLPGGVFPIRSLALYPDARNRKITLTWSNPSYAGQNGVLVQVSTSPIRSVPERNVAYAVGATLGDGSIVRSTAIISSYVETGLQLDSTRYFSLYSKDVSNNYSTAISTYAFLDLPPMAPAGFYAEMIPGDTAHLILHWSPVVSKAPQCSRPCLINWDPALWPFA